MFRDCERHPMDPATDSRNNTIIDPRTLNTSDTLDRQRGSPKTDQNPNDPPEDLTHRTPIPLPPSISKPRTDSSKRDTGKGEPIRTLYENGRNNKPVYAIHQGVTKEKYFEYCAAIGNAIVEAEEMDKWLELFGAGESVGSAPLLT